MSFEKATRSKSRLKMAITGPSGSGKTFSALRLAKGIGGKIALIDSENHSASLYSNVAEFDTQCISAPFEPEKYIDMIHDAERLGYSVLIIDSITHEWNGKGGILEIHDKVTRSSAKGNSYMAWNDVTPRHNAFIEAILQSTLHIIVTMRSKQDFILIEKNGKTVPQKVGLAPIQREGFEYEMTTVFDLSLEHLATKSKDRTNLFDKFSDVLTEEIGQKLLVWLETGKEPEPDENQIKAKLKADATLYGAKMLATKDLKEFDALIKENKSLMENLLGMFPNIHKQLEDKQNETVARLHPLQKDPNKAPF